MKRGCSYPKEHGTKPSQDVCETILVVCALQRYELSSILVQSLAITLKSGKGSLPMTLVPELAVEGAVCLHRGSTHGQNGRFQYESLS